MEEMLEQMHILAKKLKALNSVLSYIDAKYNSKQISDAVKDIQDSIKEVLKKISCLSTYVSNKAEEEREFYPPHETSKKIIQLEKIYVKAHELVNYVKAA